MKKYSLIILVIIISNTLNAQQEIKYNDASALEFFTKSQLVFSKKIINPMDLAGCLVLSKAGVEPQYLNILSENVKKSLNAQQLTSEPFSSMLTKELAAKFNFLGFIGISSSKKLLLQTVIKDVWRLEAPQFITNVEVLSNVKQIGRLYRKLGFNVDYNQSVQYSILTYSEFQENSEDLQSAFSYFDAEGKKYVQISNYRQKELIAIAPINIDPILDASDKDITLEAFSKISQQEKSKSLKSSIELKEYDGNILKQFKPSDIKIDYDKIDKELLKKLELEKMK